MNDRDLMRNGSGCLDPTAYEAIKNIEREDENFHKLLHMIIEGRIVLVDKTSGKVWR